MLFFFSSRRRQANGYGDSGAGKSVKKTGKKIIAVEKKGSPACQVKKKKKRKKKCTCVSTKVVAVEKDVSLACQVTEKKKRKKKCTRGGTDGVAVPKGVGPACFQRATPSYRHPSLAGAGALPRTQTRDHPRHCNACLILLTRYQQ